MPPSWPCCWSSEGSSCCSIGGAPARNDAPAQLAKTVNDLPASTRAAAAHTVELTITTPGHVVDVAALVLPHDLAVTTLAIPVGAEITGTTATKSNFPVTLEGRDDVMGFSIVHLGANIAPQKLDAMPASAAVVAIAPIVTGPANTPEYDWTMTTLGDPSNDAHGVVRYLAVKSTTSLNNFVDAIAIDPAGHVVAVLSSTHFWYPAQFVAQVANVVATGHGCHAELGVMGKNEQGGGVLITKIVRYSPAAHAGLKSRRRHHRVGRHGCRHVEPAGLHAVPHPRLHEGQYHLRHEHEGAPDDCTLGCPSKLVP